MYREKNYQISWGIFITLNKVNREEKKTKCKIVLGVSRIKKVYNNIV